MTAWYAGAVMPAQAHRPPPRAVLLLALALAGCPQEAHHGEAQPPPPTPTPVPVPSAQAPPPTPFAEASIAPDAGAPPREYPKRTGTPGSTRGTIACGEVRCKAPGEMCLWDEDAFTWSCKPAPKLGPDEPAPGMMCDDGTDCPQGETCCEEWLTMGSRSSACVPRAQVNGRCSDELCVEGGARCPPGRTCKLRPGEDSGVCEAEKGPATCAGKKRCPASAPICVNGPHGLACVAHGTPELAAAPSDRRWECTRQSDCNAGDTCFFSFGDTSAEMSTYCGRWSPAYGGTLVCEPGGANPCVACSAKYECFPDKDAPPWLGRWSPKD